VERHVYTLIVVVANRHYENPIKHVGIVQSGNHHYLIYVTCSYHDILDVKQQLPMHPHMKFSLITTTF